MFKCCKNCVAPKRTPGCHDHCPEYIAERAEYDKKKADDDRRRHANSLVYGQRDRAVCKAMNKQRRRGGTY